MGVANFEDVHKTAYSHGLESIYAIENVDLRSIRRFQAAPTSIEKKEIKKSKKASIPLQLEFPFGGAFQNWIEPFFLREPIHVLGLSKFAEKALLEHGKKKLNDLLCTDLRTWIFLRGVGQGHVEEIQEKLNTYLAGRDRKKAQGLDFVGWLRALFGEVPTKKLFVVFEKYQLQELVPVTAAESVEIKRLNAEMRKEWVETALASVDRNILKQDLHTLTEIFLKPWIDQRLGVVRRKDLLERLEGLSEDSAYAKKALKLLQECFGKNDFLFKPFLEDLENGVYCTLPNLAKAFKGIQACALTYFYTQQVQYELNHLVTWIERECARRWIGFPVGFVEKVLKFSASFSVRRSLDGSIIITKCLVSGQTS